MGINTTTLQHKECYSAPDPTTGEAGLQPDAEISNGILPFCKRQLVQVAAPLVVEWWS